jgi:putative hydrolase of the HAD superfamily
MAGSKTKFNREDIDTLLLDMDGTVLDLAFDNYFWLELLPQHLAQERGISVEVARRQMRSHTQRVLGTLQWYCIDHWSDLLALDVGAIKHDVRHLIAYLPGALEFLRLARHSGLRLIVVTNAHRRTLSIKLRQTHLERHVDAVYSSHDFGHPKESAEFWDRFEAAADVRRDRSVLVDDSPSVVEAARKAGLAATVMIARPDSRQPRQTATPSPGIDALADLRDWLPVD